MNTRYLAALLCTALVATATTTARATGHDNPMPSPAEHGAAARPQLRLSEPRADLLKDGYVYLAFRVENMTVLPLYTEINGKAATGLKPAIGHLHVFVDDSKWSWIHALTDAIYFGPLPPGRHSLRIELVDASHSVIETQSLHFVVP